MLTTTNHVLVLTVFGSSLQDYLLHLPRDQGEANRPVVAWIVLFALEKKTGLMLAFLSPLEPHPSA